MSEAPVETPPPTAQGTLAKTPFPHLLIYTLERALTGSIELRVGDTPAGLILVQGGMPAKVRLAEPVAYLGVVLHELGLITEEQLNDSLARMAAERRLHGQILIEMGALTQDGLLAGLEAQVVRKIEHLFSLPTDATFTYYDGFDGLASFGGPELTQVDPLPLVWAGIRQEPSWEHVHQALSRVDRAAMRLAPTAQIERFNFSKQEAAAAELLRNRALRLHELTSSKTLSPSAAQLLVYCLMITKQLELVELSPSMRPPAPAPPAAPSTPTGKPPGASQSQAFARVQLSKAQRPGPPIVEEASTEMSFDARRATPFPPSMPKTTDAPPSPKVAASSSAPESAPVSQRPPTSQRIPSAPPVPQAFASPSPQAPAVASAPPQAPAASPEPPPSSRSMPAGPPSSSRMPAVLSPADAAAIRDRIAKRAEEIDKLDYFQMLNVARDAPTTEVQKAFFTAAKTWHPDKLPQQLADVRDQCSKVFARLVEAHATLVDTTKRENYMTLVKEGGATPDEQAQVVTVLEAVGEFQKAEHFLKRSDWAKAEEHVRKAFTLDPQQPDYIAAMAWIEAMKPENMSEEQTVRRIDMLNEALKLNPNCERAYFYRGMLLKRIDKMPQAYKDFKKAMDLNEHNVDAAREVRLYNMRKEPGKSGAPGPRTSNQPPPKGGGGLFGKLFKK